MLNSLFISFSASESYRELENCYVRYAYGPSIMNFKYKITIQVIIEIHYSLMWLYIVDSRDQLRYFYKLFVYATIQSSTKAIIAPCSCGHVFQHDTITRAFKWRQLWNFFIVSVNFFKRLYLQIIYVLNNLGICVA